MRGHGLCLCAKPGREPSRSAASGQCEKHHMHFLIHCRHTLRLHSLLILCSFTNQARAQLDSLRYWKECTNLLLVSNASVTWKFCSSQVTVQHEVCRLHPQRAVHHVMLSPSTTVFQVIIERTAKASPSTFYMITAVLTMHGQQELGCISRNFQWHWRLVHACCFVDQLA